MTDNNNGGGNDVLDGDDLLDSNNEIAVKLRAFYTSIQDEEIPDRFLDLLEKLDQAEVAFAELDKRGDTA